jgi:hypothetical protein
VRAETEHSQRVVSGLKGDLWRRDSQVGGDPFAGEREGAGLVALKRAVPVGRGGGECVREHCHDLPVEERQRTRRELAFRRVREMDCACVGITVRTVGVKH